MKILVTGASGLLGTAFATAAKQRQHTLVGQIGQFKGQLPALDEVHRIDLSDPHATERLVLDQFPDAIVNCAAISQPSVVEQHREQSRRINVHLPEQLARLAHHLSATFIHISSEQVYDGTANAPYHTESDTNPLNSYGQQKVESEERVHNAAAAFATTLRVPLLNGNSQSGHRSIHEQLLNTWSQQQKAKQFTDEYRQPCLVDNLAQVMVELCERHDLKGIFHWAGSEVLSRYEIGLAIARHFGLPEEGVVAATQGDDPRFNSRPARLALDLNPLVGKLKTSPQSFADQLDQLIIPHHLRDWYNAI